MKALHWSRCFRQADGAITAALFTLRQLFIAIDFRRQFYASMRCHTSFERDSYHDIIFHFRRHA